MARPRVFVTQPIAESALARLRAVADVEVNRGFKPRPRQGKARRGGEALRHSAVAAARHRRCRGARAPIRGLKAVSSMNITQDRIDLAEATRRGIPVTNIPGHRHRRHRRYRLRPPARGGAQYRARRQIVSERRLSGLAVQSSRRRGGDRPHARPGRLRPHRPGHGTARPRLRYEHYLCRSAPAAGRGGSEVRRRLSQLRRSVARGRFRVAASAAVAARRAI